MPEFLAFLLAVTNIFLIILAFVAIHTAMDLRATLRRINAALPDAEAALRDARQVLHRTQRMMRRGDVATEHVAAVIHRACEALGGVLDTVAPLRSSIERLVFRKHTNGAGAAPRRHHRSR